MELWQTIAVGAAALVAIILAACGYLKYRDNTTINRTEHRQISEQNRIMLTNHLQHHEGTLEPWMADIATKVSKMDGKLDILINRK